MWRMWRPRISSVQSNKKMCSLENTSAFQCTQKCAATCEGKPLSLNDNKYKP